MAGPKMIPTTSSPITAGTPNRLAKWPANVVSTRIKHNTPRNVIRTPPFEIDTFYHTLKQTPTTEYMTINQPKISKPMFLILKSNFPYFPQKELYIASKFLYTAFINKGEIK
ncbi:hypothetical protein HMPREF0495_01649 [Levilactobacillus brevis ATCC 14869 = DSM 20054]|uniref:Uncharacterized protein n=1 Tax=Levilactobacillus brevis ATCC 14869 = DSM 20054 TaxID=649758 RepID=U2NYI6_LEVBR|nr:hypothetical protein HMPREF0495_01649 [Levilactobacillus brevis ATCC 14869 = DSM 20054]